MSRKGGPGRPSTPIEVRFWSKVVKTSTCWNWTDAPNNDGYGRLGLRGRHVLAHRLSWELHGLEPLLGRSLDHVCHNRMCVNPRHLRIATQSENNQNYAGAQMRNPTGARGVQRTPNGRPFRSVVTHEGKRHYLGRFDTLEAASEAARAKRLELYTHNEADRRAVTP
jgi:hypothetical protein